MFRHSPETLFLAGFKTLHGRLFQQLSFRACYLRVILELPRTAEFEQSGQPQYGCVSSLIVIIQCITAPPLDELVHATHCSPAPK